MRRIDGGVFSFIKRVTMHLISLPNSWEVMCFGRWGHRPIEKTIDEFSRRFEQHILPFRFTKIRHYGYLKNHKRTERLAKIFADLRLPKSPPKVRIPIKQRMLEKKGVDITICPVCNKGTLERGATYYHGVLSTTEPIRTVVYSPPP